MTFYCQDLSGRRCQAEESMLDLDRILAYEDHELIVRHVQSARDALETAVAVMRGVEATRKREAPDAVE